MLLLININKILYPVIDIHTQLSTSTRSTNKILYPVNHIYY